MKKLLALILALALAAGMYAVFAEGGSDSEAAQTPAAAEETVTEETVTGETMTETASSDETEALREAWKAYREAKKAAKLEAFEEELKQLVEAGRLTREQADLLLKYANEGKLPGRYGSSGDGKGKSSSGESGKRSRGKGSSSGSGSAESNSAEGTDANSSATGKKSSGENKSGRSKKGGR